MDNNKNGNSENRLYDPEIVSILFYVLGALGSLGGIVCTIDYIDRQCKEIKERHFTEELKNKIKFEISNSFRNIFLSVDIIRQRLEFIGKICQVLSSNDKKLSVYNLSFGTSSILINDPQFRAYQNDQKSILKEIGEINDNVSSIECLIPEILHLVDNTAFIINKKLQNKLKQIITAINELMQDFRKISINEFMDRTICLCRDIEATKNLIEDKKDLM